MTAEEVQLWTAIGGFLTTLGGVALTGWLALLVDQRRSRREDDRRWHADRFRMLSKLQTLARQADQDLANGAASLRIYKMNQLREDRAELADKALDVVVTRGRDAGLELKEAFRLLSDLELVMTGTVVELATDMLNLLVEGQDRLTDLDSEDSIWQVLHAADDKRKEMIAEARLLLTPPEASDQGRRQHRSSSFGASADKS